MHTLILGGVRSGKSRMAETLATQSGAKVVYIATALAGDAEMSTRIARHRADRPAHWQTIEEPYALAATLQRHDAKGHVLLIDCLTLWLTQLLCSNVERMQAEVNALLGVVGSLQAEVIMVSNETGMGVVPLAALTRQYCDEAGRLHQALAATCERVILMVAGLPLALKGPLPCR